MQPTPPPPPERSFVWPLGLNLILLMLGVAMFGTDVLPFAIAGLFLINTLAAIIMAISKRMHFVPAFLLSGLVVLIVGFGACALLLSGIGGQH